MKQWTVNYRGNGGKQTSLVIEAEDRKGVLAELKKRGISAVRVEEAKGKVKPAKPRQAMSIGTKPSAIRGVLAGLIVVVLAGVSVWIVTRKSAEPNRGRAESDAKAKEVKTTSVAKHREESSPVSAPNVSAPKVIELSEDERLLAGRDTNEWIVVTDPNTGKKHLSKLMHPGLKNQPPPYFERHSLNIIDAIQYCEMGDPLIGVEIDDRFMRDFQAALLEKIEINKDDDEDRVAHKEAMVETLKELRSELKNGGDLKSIINDALKERRRVAGLKDVMIEERARMRSEGVPDEVVVEYERTCNKKLAELGAKPMITKELIIKKGLERKGLLVE